MDADAWRRTRAMFPKTPGARRLYGAASTREVCTRVTWSGNAWCLPEADAGNPEREPRRSRSGRITTQPATRRHTYWTGSGWEKWRIRKSASCRLHFRWSQLKRNCSREISRRKSQQTPAVINRMCRKPLPGTPGTKRMTDPEGGRGGSTTQLFQRMLISAVEVRKTQSRNHTSLVAARKVQPCSACFRFCQRKAGRSSSSLWLSRWTRERRLPRSHPTTTMMTTRLCCRSPCWTQTLVPIRRRRKRRRRRRRQRRPRRSRRHRRQMNRRDVVATKTSTGCWMSSGCRITKWCSSSKRQLISIWPGLVVVDELEK